MKSIACIGMAVADLVVAPVDSFHFTQDVTLVDRVESKPGGDAANVALNLAVMNTPVSLHTKLGNDMFGQWLISHYQKVGVETRYIKQCADQSTGTAIALIDKQGERVFLYKGGTIDTLCVDDLDHVAITRQQMVHASGYFLLPQLEPDLPELFKQAKANGALTSLDVGWDNSGQWYDSIEAMLPHLTYFLPTLNEAQQIAKQDDIGACAEFFIAQGVEQVVIKAGAKGAYVHDGLSGYWVQGTPVDEVIDTTGAGDGFVSGFLASISRGTDLRTAVENANQAGALVVQSFGSTGAIQSYQQIEEKGKNYEAAI